MKFKLVLFSAIAMVAAGAIVLFVGCNKQGAKNASPASAIAGARQYFESSVLPASAPTDASTRNPRAGLHKTPIWEMAYTTHLDIGDVVIVPLSIKDNLYVKKNQGNLSISAGLLTSLLIYTDSVNNYHAEVVTKIPDDTYVMDLSPVKKFSGVARVEDWQGNFIKGYHYTNGKSDRNYTLSTITRANAGVDHSPLLLENCTITDWYSCASSNGGDTWTCDYLYESSACEDAGGGGPSGGGGGTVYQDVYHYTGGGAPSGSGTWRVSTSIGGFLCYGDNFNFTTDINNNYIANINGITESLNNSVQGNITISFPNTCLGIPGGITQETASDKFIVAYDNALQELVTELNAGSTLPENASARFAALVSSYLTTARNGSVWSAYGNCSGTVATNVVVYCQP